MSGGNVDCAGVGKVIIRPLGDESFDVKIHPSLMKQERNGFNQVPFAVFTDVCSKTTGVFMETNGTCITFVEVPVIQ